MDDRGVVIQPGSKLRSEAALLTGTSPAMPPGSKVSMTQTIPAAAAQAVCEFIEVCIHNILYDLLIRFLVER